MTNPFEYENGEYLVLVNEEQQYSLWPAFHDIPAGWSAVGPRGNCKECLSWIETNWTDMRPRSLVKAMESRPSDRWCGKNHLLERNPAYGGSANKHFRKRIYSMLDSTGNTRETSLAAGDIPLSPLSGVPNVPRQTAQQTQGIGTGDAISAPLAFPETLPDDPAALKQQCKDFYNSVSHQLNTTEFAEFAHFLNYGYVADGSPQNSRVTLPQYFLNRNSVKLVLEMVGDCPIDGKIILDVGCGRGGTVSVLNKFFKPASVSGVDLSPVAISFCRNTHKGPSLSFQEGDAENLPFENSSFDIITNVESSHSYPQIEKFYAEVHRLLRSGGRFLYTDVLSTKQIVTTHEVLQHLGMKLEVERDIGNNVLLSCNEIAASRLAAFQDGNDSQTMRDFLGAPGSRFYEAIRSGASRYMIWRFVKSA